MNRSHSFHVAGVAAIALVLLSGCSGESSEPALVTAQEEVMNQAEGGGMAGLAMPAPPPFDAKVAADVAPAPSSPMARSAAATPHAMPASGWTTQAAPSDSVVANSMIIRTGQAQVQVDSLEAGIAALERTAEALGGWVAHSSIDLGERQWRSAQLELKIPSARWDDLLTGLSGIGELRQLTTSTEDVGEQFVDLTAQLGNAEWLEARYLRLLQTRTGSLEDLLAVERELARVRERIESLQGRLRYLGNRVAVSTLHVSLAEPVNLLGVSPESQPLRDAFSAAWANFLAVITGGIALLGGVLPIALILAGMLWGWRAIRRAKRPRSDHAGS